MTENNNEENNLVILKSLAISIITGFLGGLILGILENYKESITAVENQVNKNNPDDYLKDMNQLGLKDYFASPEGIKELENLRKYG